MTDFDKDAVRERMSKRKDETFTVSMPVAEERSSYLAKLLDGTMDDLEAALKRIDELEGGLDTILEKLPDDGVSVIEDGTPYTISLDEYILDIRWRGHTA